LAKLARTLARTNDNTLRFRWRHVSTTLNSVSTKRLPLALGVPNDSFRQITAGRNARSLALLVGSTPGVVTNVHSHDRCSH
jgi:hypothetical protein